MKSATMSPEATPTPVARPRSVAAPVPSHAVRSRQFAEHVLLPTLVIVLLLVVWEVAVRALNVPENLLPAPSVIGQRIVDAWPNLVDNAIPTTLQTIESFILATVMGVVIAAVLTSFRLVNSAFYPIVVFFQLIPKVALAPLFVVWMGIGAAARIEFGVFIAFFPVVVSTMAGLRGTPADALRLCKGLGANRLQIFGLVRLPYALPHIFSGMKVAMTLAMIGVIVAEFISAQAGLGYLIVFASSQADTALILAAILFLCVIGLVLYGAVALAEKAATRLYGA